MDKLLQDMKTKADILEAAQYISRKMKKHDINKDGKICLLEFKKAFAEVKRKHPDYNHLLFGDNLDEESQFDEMDTDADGKVKSNQQSDQIFRINLRYNRRGCTTISTLVV